MYKQWCIDVQCTMNLRNGDTEREMERQGECVRKRERWRVCEKERDIVEQYIRYQMTIVRCQILWQ